MADDDIERLLRELAETSGVSPATPASSATPESGLKKAPRGDVAKPSAGSGRLAFAMIAAVGLGAAGWFLGLVMPFTSAVSAGIGASAAAFVTALIAGPPRWFSS